MALAITSAACLHFHGKTLPEYLSWVHHCLFYSQAFMVTGVVLLWDTAHFAHATWRWLKKSEAHQPTEVSHEVITVMCAGALTSHQTRCRACFQLPSVGS